MDMCSKCMVRCDIGKCLDAVCNLHETWIVDEIKTRIKQACADAVMKCEYSGVGDSDNISRLDAYEACMTANLVVAQLQYKDHEFCNDTKCDYIDFSGCQLRVNPCVKTANEFQKWLKDNGYKIVKDGE